MKMLIKFVSCSKKWKKKSSGIFLKPGHYHDDIQAIICEYQVSWYTIRSFLLQAFQTTDPSFCKHSKTRLPFISVLIITWPKCLLYSFHLAFMITAEGLPLNIVSVLEPLTFDFLAHVANH